MIRVRAFVIGWMAAVCCGTGWADAFPARYWPTFPAPTKVVASEAYDKLPFEQDVALQTLAGLVAYSARTGGTGEYVWLTNAGGSYGEWLKRLEAYSGGRVENARALSLWELADRYREQGVIKGYILYRTEKPARSLYEGKSTDVSSNVATALCAVYSAIAIEERLEPEARKHGLECLFDARGKDEAWLWKTHGKDFSRDLVAHQDPLNPVMRAEVVAMGGMLLSGCGPLYEEVMAACAPGAPVLGWGIGGEDEQTGPSSRQGLIQTATNWCVNLQVTSAGRTGLDYPLKAFAPPARVEIKDGDDTRYVSFILSDGDNVQWLMLNFCLGDEARQYWASPARGKIPFGWTTCAMDLLQLCPYTLDYLRETATDNDGFVLLGGGYYYPDWFGQGRSGEPLLPKQAARTEAYLKKCGLSAYMVNVQDWKSESTQKACETYAKEMPSLDGMFVIQYAPYTGGHGAIRWVKRPDGSSIPVVSARNAIWAQRGNDPWEGAPTRVAAMLNEWASKPVASPEDRFAWVIVHAWSWFRQPADGIEEEVDQTKNYPGAPDIARGYLPTTWCAERLSPRIRLLTPPAFLRTLRAANPAQDARWRGCFRWPDLTGRETSGIIMTEVSQRRCRP